jgi:hypothetical protein
MSATSPHSPRYDELLPAYALGALDGEELRELEAHLAAGCPICALELERLAADLEGLAIVAAAPDPAHSEIPEHPELPEITAAGDAAPSAATATMEVPSALRSRLLAQVAAEPRRTPGAGTATQAVAPAPAPILGAGEVLPFAPAVAPAPPRQRTASPGAARWWMAAAAALLLVAVWGVVRQATLGEQLTRLRGERAALAARADALERRMAQVQAQSERLASSIAVIAAPGVQSVSLSGMGTAHAATGRTFIDASDRKAVFYAYHLPSLGPNQTYQLWFVDEDENKTSAGIFSVDARGEGSLVVEQAIPVEHIQGWVVTIEPRGGRPQPTGSIALAG